MMNSIELPPTQLDMHRAFIELWKELPYSQIRVNKVCQQTPIARSTFYTYYDDLEQLKDDVEKRLIQGLAEKNQPLFTKEIKQVNDIAFVQSTLDYVESERDSFEAFLINQVNVNFIEKWNQATKQQLLHIFPPKQENFDMKLDIFASSVIAAITHYLKKPAGSVNVHDLNRLIFKLLD